MQGRVGPRLTRRQNPSAGQNLPHVSKLCVIWGFPKIRGTFLGVLIIRTIVFWGLYWDPLILGNYHIASSHRTLLRPVL